MDKAIQTINQNEELVVLENQPLSVEGLLKMAVEKALPVETVEKLLAMRKELKAEFAKEQYDLAMSNFQRDCPVIKKHKEGGKTNSGVVAYMYAPIEDIVEQTKELIAQNNFSYSFKTETRIDGAKAICIVKHKSGHSENSEVDVPLSTKTGVMSAPQVVAATITFAKRYAFCNAFGITTGGEDEENELKEPKDFSKEELLMRKCQNFDELKTVWASLPAESKIALESVKNELKLKYESK